MDLVDNNKIKPFQLDELDSLVESSKKKAKEFRWINLQFENDL